MLRVATNLHYTVGPFIHHARTLLSLVFMWVSVGVSEGPGLTKWDTCILLSWSHIVEIREEKEQRYHGVWAASVWGLVIVRLFTRYGYRSFILS